LCKENQKIYTKDGREKTGEKREDGRREKTGREKTGREKMGILLVVISSQCMNACYNYIQHFFNFIQ
jgi:hypothetical protein